VAAEFDPEGCAGTAVMGPGADEDGTEDMFLSGCRRRDCASDEAFLHAAAGGRGAEVGGLRGGAEDLTERRDWNSE
jgi:hypothetical protein